MRKRHPLLGVALVSCVMLAIAFGLYLYLPILLERAGADVTGLSESADVQQDESYPMETAHPSQVAIRMQVLKAMTSPMTNAAVLRQVYENTTYDCLESHYDAKGQQWYAIDLGDNLVGYVQSSGCIPIWEDVIELAAYGRINDLPGAIGGSVDYIIEIMGKPIAEGNYIGGYYYRFDSTTYQTEVQGSVKRIAFISAFSGYGIEVGMTEADVVRRLGEPNETVVDEQDISELFSGLHYRYVYEDYQLFIDFSDEDQTVTFLMLSSNENK